MKYLLLFSLTFIFSTSNAYTQTLTADQIYSKANNAIVTIYTFDNNDNPISQGSGVVLNQKGWVVTNYHVYKGANKLIVKHGSKIVAYSNIISYDEEKDILILKIADRSFPSIPIGNSELLKVGQKIYTIGSPLGFENTISEGIISGLRSNKEKTENFIQISAAISPGSSGGAVINTKGELVAITTLTATKGQNLNFAIPVNDILALYNKTNIKQNNSTASENGFLYPVFVNNKWGYINNLGTLIIKPQFDYGDDFSDGLAKIKIAQKYGFIDKTGKIIINPQFDDIGNFHEGLAKIKVSGKYGFVNKKGEIIIKPQFEDANNFSEGYARVIEKSDFWTKKGGYIDKSGNYMISYEGADFDDFSEGLAAVNINGKFGYINKKSETVIKPQFSYVFPFREGIAWVCTSKEGVGVMASFSSDATWGCIDKRGDFIIPYQRFFWPNSFYEGLASVKLIQPNGISKFCYIDKTGNIVIQPQFDLPGNFHEGLASVKVGDKYGYINKIGKFIIDPVLDGAADFEGGIAKVWVGKSNAYIDKTGNWIWNPQNLQIVKQTVQSDEKIGFKSLRIGDNQSKYSGSINLINTNKSTSTYQYTPLDDDLYNLFDLRINKITLSFDNNHRLVEITLIKSYSGSNSLQDAFADASKIDPNLINLFGKQTGIIDINTTAELKLGRVWKTNSVTVKAYAEDYGMGNGTDLKVSITDNLFIQQSIKSGF
ncbi:MAG: WG repeat-containing protein [Chitinophagaceae bacterium]|nr:WG repeat-containing protein [Chitinophagaceae bacterium]MBP7109165.1 WG repeat-containing protein [Chitinophagaceae bacterium]